MNKIRLQQSQKWIKLIKTLVASLHFFKARLIKMLLCNCKTLRASFLHSIDLQSFQFNRPIWMWIRDSKSKSRSRLILSKRWFKKTQMPLFRLIKLARSTLIFLKQEPNWIRKKIQLKWILRLPKLSKLPSPKINPLCWRKETGTNFNSILSSSFQVLKDTSENLVWKHQQENI